jgi:hypothetical protein
VGPEGVGWDDDERKQAWKIVEIVSLTGLASLAIRAGLNRDYLMAAVMGGFLVFYLARERLARR